MIARLSSIAAAAGLLAALAAPAGADPGSPPLTPGPHPAALTAAYPTPNTDACPHRLRPPAAVDASEVPAPGSTTPPPVPVPAHPVGGDALGGCGLVLPAGAPPVPHGIDSAGWLIADLTDGTVLAAKDPHGRYRPASTIKLLLAQVALRDLDLDRVVDGTQADLDSEGDRAGVAPGGKYTVRDLLGGLLLVSGNDTANALARALGGTAAAVAKMNARAAELGAHDTRAATPSGLDGPGMSTSPYDLALILRGALADPRFQPLAARHEITFPGHPPLPVTTTAIAPPVGEVPPGGVAAARTTVDANPSVAPYPLVNENLALIKFPGAVAGKTGYTDDAKKTYVGAVDRDGHRFVVVQMYGLNREDNLYWDQFQRLLDYGVALRGKSVGRLGDAPAAATQTRADGAAAPAAASSNGPKFSKVLLGIGGLAVIGALVAVAMRTGRHRE
jgi:D-alanyl-D-alanine carboxypeptidase (penicillin-binding protein 5/6)